MGWIRKPVRLGGIDDQGEMYRDDALKVDRSNTLFDSGSSATVISSRVATEAKVKITGTTTASSAGRSKRTVPTGYALVAAGEGCGVAVVEVVIDDELTVDFGVEMIVGHDYMQKTRMQLDLAPRKLSATCEQPKRKRKASK